MAQIDNGFSITPGSIRNLDSARNRDTGPERARNPEDEDNRTRRTRDPRESRDLVDVASPETASSRTRLAEEEFRRNPEPAPTQTEPRADAARPSPETIRADEAAISPENRPPEPPPTEPPPEDLAAQAGTPESRSRTEPETDTSTVEQLNRNPGALRGDNLGTDLALRENRGQRSLLQPSRETAETPPPPTGETEAPAAEPSRRDRTEESAASRMDSAERPERRAATAEGAAREDETNPPTPRNEPEAIQTQRGQNVNRLI